MKNKSILMPKNIFYALVIIFVLMVVYFAVPYSMSMKRTIFPFISVLGFIFFALGVLLIIMTFKKQIKGKLKTFFLLTGGAASGVLVSVILHNLVYGLFIQFFGENFWERTGSGDEPFFFLIALVLCPIVFLVGMIGSIVLLLKKR